MIEEPKKQPSLIFYFLIFFAVILLNTYIFPILNNQSVQEVDYGTFLNMVDEGMVEEVEIQQNIIAFTPRDDQDSSTYKTGVVDDPNLVERLHEANVKFTQVIPKETSPLLTFALTWMIPILLFIFL